MEKKIEKIMNKEIKKNKGAVIVFIVTFIIGAIIGFGIAYFCFLNNIKLF